MKYNIIAPKKAKPALEQGMTVLYFLIYLAVALTIALNQPLYDTYPSLCNPPDEHARYQVPLYICNHGTLPEGYEEELFSGDCKWTYGFYTLLPYMAQGYAMRFTALFTDSPLALLYTARLVNVFIGFLMAYFVLLLGKELFPDSRVRWVFCFLITFLPQSLFLHTYVNPDSMCLLSTALMLYGLVRGYGDGFSVKSCAPLTVGIILCTLSYYNAYGFILGCIVLFTAYFLNADGGKWRFDIKGFLKKGLSVSLIVLACTSWSFIRNYILYDGDIIGLNTMQNFIKSFGIVRETYASRGEPLTAMLFDSTFFTKLAVSFIANYGSVSLYAPEIVYVFYFLLLAIGTGSMLFIRSKEPAASLTERKWLRGLFHATMISCILMPFLILVRFAYSVDYQAQGRYIMPCIIPLMYYVTCGLKKLPLWDRRSEKGKTILTALVLTGILAALLLTVADALPYYLQASVL